MTTLINSLILKVPPRTADRLLAKGFEHCQSDDWHLSPHQFSFTPFLQPDTSCSNDQKFESIWTNWIHRDGSNTPEEQTLTIEFETEKKPALNAVEALIEWLNKEHLVFNLHYQYRLENESWDGELHAENIS